MGILWLMSEEGVRVLSNIHAEYFTFTYLENFSYTDPNTGRATWTCAKFGEFYDQNNLTQCGHHSDLKNSPLERCINIKTISLQTIGYYVYFRGYKDRPKQDHMIH